MRLSPQFLAIACSAFAAASPLFAETIYEIVDQAQSAIMIQFPSEDSRARKMALNDLDTIIDSDKTEEEKIQVIKDRFLKSASVPVQTNVLLMNSPAQLVFRPPLQWQIQSIEIAYEIDSVTTRLFSAESLYQEENSKSHDDSTSSSDVTNINLGAKTQLDIDVGGGIQKPSKGAWNPLNWLQAKAGFQWVTSGYAGIDYNKTKSSQWTERAQRALSNNYTEKVAVLHKEETKNPHLTFYILFKNNTDKDLFLAPQDFSVTVYAGENRPLADAYPDTPLRRFRIPRNAYADLKFRAELNTSSAEKLIGYMCNNEPSIRLDRAQSTIASSDGSIEDAVQNSLQVETVPFHCRDFEMRILKYDQGKATTVADAMRAVNAVFESPWFELSDNACISLMGIPLGKADKNVDIHQLPVIVINDEPFSERIPVEKLNQPLSDAGLSVDVMDLMESSTWDNASDELRQHCFTCVKSIAESGIVEAQYWLGECCYKGLGTNENKEEAVKWWFKAAEQGSPKAQFNLGICYYNGIGVEKDYAEAVKWYRKAAKQGNSMAQNQLGFCYKDGKGVEKNIAEAVKWFRKAVEQGDETAVQALKDSAKWGVLDGDARQILKELGY